MINRPDDRTRLLAETLDGEWAAGSTAAMAKRAAAHARRRRAVRSAATAATLGAAAVAVFFFSARRPAAPLPASHEVIVKAGYEIISDEEFLATVHDRPLLVLPQENGSKKIVLLDR